MDVYELLKNDHQKVSKLFDQIESASGQAKKRVFTQLKTELDLHAELEERLFYPRLEKAQASRDITLEAYEEHKVVKDLLAELASDGVNDEWEAKLKVLRENVEHHVEEEEGELFDKAEDQLSDEEAEQIGAQMEAEKARVLGTDESSRNGRGGAGKQQATKRSGGKKTTKQSPGVLSRLANFVGLGDSSSEGGRKASGGARKAGKKAGKKSTSKGASKTVAKSSKSSGARKSSGKSAPAGRGARKKATKSSSSKGSSSKRARSK